MTNLSYVVIRSFNLPKTDNGCVSKVHIGEQIRYEFNILYKPYVKCRDSVFDEQIHDEN